MRNNVRSASRNLSLEHSLKGKDFSSTFLVIPEVCIFSVIFLQIQISKNNIIVAFSLSIWRDILKRKKIGKNGGFSTEKSFWKCFDICIKDISYQYCPCKCAYCGCC